MADKMLKDLTKDTTAAGSDSLMIWQGSNNARQISKSDFLKEFNVASLINVATPSQIVTVPANATKVVDLDLGIPNNARLIFIGNFMTPNGVYVKNSFSPSTNKATVKFHNTNSSDSTFETIGQVLALIAPTFA